MMKDSPPSARLKPFQLRFDFEVGYLVKSPCRGCEDRFRFPGCAKNCGTLDKVQSLLSDTISCARRR
ncbi:MAG: hypothetical protein ACOWWM_17815 [Desulfobacterales bacterium]